MGRYRLVIFDLDGTLFDTAPDISDALNFALSQLGLPGHSESTVRGMIGNGIAALIRSAVDPRQDTFEAAARLFRERHGAHLCDRTRAYEGVPELITQLSCHRAIATNKPGPWAREICQWMGLLEHFAVVLGDGDVTSRKPDPEMVEQIRAQMGVGAAETLMVGDGPTDIETAKRAGIDACAVGWGYTDTATLLAASPSFFAADVSALRRIVGIGACCSIRSHR